ncbi:hypothetical protein [Enterococcus olivae]
MKEVTIITTDGGKICFATTEEQLKEILGSVSKGMTLEVGNTIHYLMPNQVIRIEVESMDDTGRAIFYAEEALKKVDRVLSESKYRNGYAELNI